MHKRILCVDDEADLLDTIKEFLEVQGYHVTAATSGKEAFELAEREAAFDLVLCDIAMPEMDGLSLLKLLRTDKRYVTTPFIFLTALGQKDDMIKAHRLGCDEYLVKPVDFDMLDVLVASRLARGEEVNLHYAEPQQAFQQLMLKALSDEMMEPTNAIVSTSSFISQMLEGKDELMEQRFNQVYQSAAQQLNMLQQLSLMLRHQANAGSELADYPCQSSEIRTHIERLLRVYHMHERVQLIDGGALTLQCDPFLISKAMSSLLIREMQHEPERQMQLAVRYGESDGHITMVMKDTAHDEGQLLACPITDFTDCALFQRALRGRIISVLFLLNIAELHQAGLELLVEDDTIQGYRVSFPAARSVQKKMAV